MSRRQRIAIAVCLALAALIGWQQVRLERIRACAERGLDWSGRDCVPRREGPILERDGLRRT